MTRSHALGQARARSLGDLVRDHPGMILALFVVLHVCLWTALPGLLHTGLPLDTVEAQSIGREWVMATYKHPAMPSWLLEASRLATGVVGWPAYLLSSLCVAATYVIVYLLARGTLGGPLALAATLPLCGTVAFSWATPEFNHNIVQMPLWAAAVWCLWRVRTNGSAIGWIALALVSAFGLYAKLSTSVLLAAMASYIVIDKRCRRQLATSGPWLGLAMFLACALPLAQWLASPASGIVETTKDRLLSRGLLSTALFIPKLMAMSLGLIVIMALGVWRGAGATGRAGVDGTSQDLAGRWFAVFMFSAPILLTIAVAIPLQVGLRSSWASAMLGLSGLAATGLIRQRLDAGASRRIVLASFALMAAIPIVYAAYILSWPLRTTVAPKVAWPQRAIAERMQTIWQDRTGQPLRYVVGDYWSGGIVAIFAQSRPSLFIEADRTEAPWIDPADLKRRGALVVWHEWRENPPFKLRSMIGTRIDGTETFPIAASKRAAPVVVHYTIIPPGTP